MCIYIYIYSKRLLLTLKVQHFFLYWIISLHTVFTTVIAYTREYLIHKNQIDIKLLSMKRWVYFRGLRMLVSMGKDVGMVKKFMQEVEHENSL